MNPNIQTQNSTTVYNTAKSCLEKNLCADKVLGCAETVNAIFETALGSPIGGGASTHLMYLCLTRNPSIGPLKFIEVTDPLPGDIIISPTGYGNNAVMPNGHVGIVAKYGILSNNSENGLLQEYYTIQTWSDRYQTKGGYPVYYFRVL